tara:strand:+ start:13 stop:687 length:675 start_codon:yes stop_codon:yes gene_type:complete
MSELLDLTNFQISNTSLSEFILGLILTIIYSLFLRKIYIKFSSSVSNKSIVANIFPLFATSIFLIVITIKSSIVLSLGLVGALSIIRFRTAIKEPEQIVYFLILTGISIASAAGAYVFPILIIVFIYIYNQINSNSRKNNVYSVNDQLIITVDKIENKTIEELIKILNNSNVNVDIQSINKKDEQTIIVLKLSDFDLNSLSIVEDFLENKKISKRALEFFSSSE